MAVAQVSRAAVSDDQVVADGVAPDPSAPTSPPGAGRRRRSRRLGLWLAVTWLVVIVLAALLADLLPLKSYSELTGVAAQRPGFRGELLGTDLLGRSMLSRVVYGARASLAVSLGAVLIGAVVGGLVGLVAGFYRGGFDHVVTTLVNSVLAFPPLVFLMAIAATVGANLVSLVIGLAVLTIPTFTRLARANSSTFAEREFVLAARSMGVRNPRILLREVLPNVVPVLLSYMSLLLAVLIIAEGSLSFLGLGVPPPTPSWGGMIAAGRQHLADAPHLVFVPGVAMFLTVFSLNVVGDRVRSHFDITPTTTGGTA
ncbi:MAG TPA: ABC transporter permease [Acidimicrobiales bacterium]|nr:ABC transporter permease [Acidimicrobiales bacterium]